MLKILKLIAMAAIFAAPIAAQAQSVKFGNDEGEYPNDGECDDRRFVGRFMAVSLDRDNIGGDASDCQLLFEKGWVVLWDEAKAQAATQCDAIDFGDNSSDWAKDGECDDPRFEGPGSTGILNASDLYGDRSDCMKACNAGQLFVRYYPGTP